MKESTKSLANMSPVGAAFDIADKNRENTKTLQTFDLSYFNSRGYFDDDGSKNYLVFQPLFKSFTRPNVSNRILAWKSKEFSEENIKPTATSDNSLTSKLTLFHNAKIAPEFKESYLKQKDATLTHKNV